MNKNDFYVAIQGIMTAAKVAGWKIDDVEQHAIYAAEGWLEEEEQDLQTTGDEDDQ
jgi:hypothetical protein